MLSYRLRLNKFTLLFTQNGSFHGNFVNLFSILHYVLKLIRIFIIINAFLV